MSAEPGQGTILLAEDDFLVRKIVEETLRSEGYGVVAVANGVEALGALTQVQPDLILSDVRMPECDGFEFLQSVRLEPRHATMPFIIMSAKADTGDLRMGMSLGADDYVTKPFNPGELLKTIEVRLARAALLSEKIKDQQRFLGRVLPHELRTPLTGIIGYADLMTMVGESGATLKPAELVDYGRNIRRSGHRLLRIAKDFSLWSWLESCRFAVRAGEELRRKPFSLTEALIHGWSRESAANYGRDSDIRVAAEEAAVLVPGDGLWRVVTHLIENACKFSLPGSPVQVAGRVDGAHYKITVSDRGRGMNETDMATIGVMRQFGRERVEQQGMGMGLVLALRFAQLAGGDLELANHPPESGLTARLVLPLARS
jgi:two-component system sensor histidine kinase/response regulator